MFLLWLRQLPHCGDRTPASVPTSPTEDRSSPPNTPVFPLVPSSYGVFLGSICSFPLGRFSCPLSAVVLHALLHLKLYSWCIHGERCTPCPPTLLPSYSALEILYQELVWQVGICFPGKHNFQTSHKREMITSTVIPIPSICSVRMTVSWKHSIKKKD